MVFISFHIPKTLNNRYYHSHFTLGETEAKGSYSIWLNQINNAEIRILIFLIPKLLLLLLWGDASPSPCEALAEGKACALFILASPVPCMGTSVERVLTK